MIHYFSVENFYSINEKQELNFTTNKKYSDSYSNFGETYISNVNCFVGANASGKTNVFKALAFLLWFAEKSYYKVNDEMSDLFYTHKLRENDSTKFEIIFDFNNKLYKYYIELTPEKVLNEVLEIKSIKGYTYLYKLINNKDEIEIKYNRNCDILQPINKKDEKRFKSLKRVTFLSFLIGMGYLDDSGLTAISKQIFCNVNKSGSKSLNSKSESIILSRELRNSEEKDDILSYLKSFDLGITDYTQDGTFTIEYPTGERVDLLGFRHSANGTSFVVSAFDESAGTIKGTFLLLKLLKILKLGGIAIIDELDAKLHYDIAIKLISLFANKETNLYNAQLIFSTHQPLFLNDRDKKQIFLCYKEDYLNTEVYRLDEVDGVRNTENFFEKYLSGAYGAVPRIGKCG